ncbi:MAG TPA: alkaline phosphatase family protein, partial [Anaeromyxobacteraceae bacterium]|nr:alkaline phosphatase family protein [Anaeromyxobacteraceae bacterium]
SFDPPHEWDQVAVQLAWSNVRQQYDMAGFVEAYANASKTDPIQQCEAMGYFTSRDVPITSFLARHFCPCDHWHCPLPTSTQPNRTMAFCGSSRIFDTSSGPRLIHTDDLLFDWLDRNGVDWRVYHDGLSFFALYPDAWKHVLGPRFRDFENYFRDMQTEPAPKDPQVIVVEPSYNDGPHIGPDHPNDNHPPAAIGWGEDFIRRTYQAATVNPMRWAKTVLLYYYDEHGGIFDHVPPQRIGYATRGNPAHVFESLGPRVSSIVASPFVEQGKPCSALFDHTSALQLLAELVTPGVPYSPDVAARKSQGIASLSVALGTTPRVDIPIIPSADIPIAGSLGKGVRLRPQNGLQASFELAASKLLDTHPAEMKQKYPDLFQWRASVDDLRRDATAPVSPEAKT